MDSYFTLKLFNLLLDKLEEPVLKLLEEVLADANSIFSEIEYGGMIVDSEKLKEVGKVLKDKNIEDGDALYDYKEILKTDNLSSNNDLIDILYTREGGFESYPPDRTAKGAPSVSAPTLKLLLEYVNEELSSR
jgi:DNA polymerase I-like protein with 3'-5' exonuclease and polymerase domains